MKTLDKVICIRVDEVRAKKIAAYIKERKLEGRGVYGRGCRELIDIGLTKVSKK